MTIDSSFLPFDEGYGEAVLHGWKLVREGLDKSGSNSVTRIADELAEAIASDVSQELTLPIILAQLAARMNALVIERMDGAMLMMIMGLAAAKVDDG